MEPRKLRSLADALESSAPEFDDWSEAPAFLRQIADQVDAFLKNPAAVFSPRPPLRVYAVNWVVYAPNGEYIAEGVDLVTTRSGGTADAAVRKARPDATIHSVRPVTDEED